MNSRGYSKRDGLDRRCLSRISVLNTKLPAQSESIRVRLSREMVQILTRDI